MKRILLCAALIAAFALGACSTITAGADQPHPLKIWKQNENGYMETFCVVDEDTGVNYIVIGGQYHSNPVGTAITPRLNADGSLYLSE